MPVRNRDYSRSLTLVLCLASGCGGGSAAPSPDLAQVTETPGVTSVAFVDAATMMPIVDGSSAQIVHGPQGGYHILVSLLAHGIWPGTPGIPNSPDDPTTSLHAFRADGTEFTLQAGNTAVLHVAWEPTGDAALLRDKQLRLDTTMPRALAGETLKLGAVVVDKDGKTASDEKHVVALAPVN